VAKEVMEILRQHDWPGNIRELQNVIERAVIMSPGAELRLPPVEVTRLSGREAPSQVRTLAEAERVHILEALRQVNWVIAGRNGAASRLGLARTTLIYRMRKLGIKAEKILTIENAIAGPARAVSHPGPIVPPSAFAASAADAGSEL
jgi:formate hydrogenlyase transcriptional activator